MSDTGNSSFDPEPSCSNILKNNEQKVNLSGIIKTRTYCPAPASKKRKREDETDNMESLYICKPFSIKVTRLSQKDVSKMLKKSDQASRTRKRHRWRNGFADKSKKKLKTEKSEKAEKSQKAEKSEKADNPEKCSESSQILNSMIPTHSWGCCRMIPFERNRSKTHRKFSLGRKRDSVGSGHQELSKNKITEPSGSKISLRERKRSQEHKNSSSKANDPSIDDAKNNLHSISLPVKGKGSITKEESSLEDEFVCRRTLPYIRKRKCKPILQIEIAKANSTDLAKSVQNQDHLKEPKSSRISRTFSGCSKMEPFVFKKSSKEKDRKQSNSDTSDCKKPLESKVCEKTDETKAPENSKDDNDENMEDFAWSSSNMWKYKRKHRSRRISSSSEDENPKKKPKMRAENNERLGPFSTKSRSHIRTLCPPSCTNREHHSSVFNFLYRKPKEVLKEGRVLLERLEDTMNPEVVRWRNRLIKLKKEIEEEEEEEDSYYLMYDDGTLSNEVLSPEAMYQMQEMTDQLISNSSSEMSKYCNESQHLEDEIYQDLTNDDALDDVLRDDDDVPLEFSEYPKILLIRLETLVGSLETEYSASEIENLEVKYIDFMMNSNFSYDKQSQSFFQVYKRLHAKRAKEKELDDLETLADHCSDEVSELQEMDEIDEKPLVILEAGEGIEESDDSNIDQDSEITTITPLPKDAVKSVNKIAPEFVTCDRISEEPKEDLLYITCKFCKLSFKNLHTFSLHKTDCYTKNKKPLKCEYCDHQYKCRRTLKLHIQHIHGQGDSLEKKTDEKKNEKINDKTSIGPKKKMRPVAAQQNLFCGVCTVEFESKESLWDHILKHTEQELQDAYKDATKNNKNQEFQEKLRRYDEKKKERELESSQNKIQKKEPKKDPKKDPRKSAFKYAQWKDRILYKMKNNKDKDAKDKDKDKDASSQDQEEIVLSSSDSENCESNKDHVDNSSTSRSSVIRNIKSAQNEAAATSRVVTMCPCHRYDTSTMVNGDMQIEMVLLCKICQVLFRRLDCFEVHYRVNKLCSMDRSSRSPKLFCSYCRIILNSLPEMRNHLEKHAKVNRQGHVTFLCNICKVMFFGVGSLFYSHWFNHNKDVNFLASRYSFPKLSIVQIVSTNSKGQNQKEEYLFVAEYVCKDCKIPFGSEVDLEKHTCSKPAAPVPVPVPEPKENPSHPKRNIIVRYSCLICKEIYANREEYNLHEKVHNHLNSTKPEYICVSSNNSEKAYICTQCKTVRMSIEDLKEHWLFHRPWREKFTCANCPDVRSNKYEEIESHCKKCFKNVIAVCLVSLVSATYQCKPCNLHFETGIEWQEHRQMCKPPPSLYKAYSYNANSGYVPVIPPGASPVPKSSISSPTQVVSSVSSASSVSSVTPRATAVPAVIPSSLNFITISPKPTLKSKATSATSSVTSSAALLEKYLQLGTAKPKKSKKRQSDDVEVIEILSESSSRSSVTEVSKETEVARKNPVVPEAIFDSHTPGNLQSTYRRKDVSLSKAVVCYPSKRKDINKKQLDPSQIPKENEEEGNLAMTAVNPEFETLLSELEGLEGSETDPLKNNLRNVRKKTNKLETSLLNTPRSEKIVSVEVDCPSLSGISSKSVEKEASPLPFEVVLLPEDEAASPKAGVSQTQIDSSKTSRSLINKITDSKTEPNASIIEEYIEYIMMDEEPKSTPTEVAPKVEKVAPTRLRVRSLAELQEIKMHLCDTCGQSFDAKDFDQHARENNCVRIQPDFVESQPNFVEAQNLEPPREVQKISTEVDYEAALRQNLVRRGVLPPNLDLVPPLMPLPIQQLNASTSKATPVSPNLLEKRRPSLPLRTQTPSPSRFNLASHARSAIQLPERTGGSVIQKRPSGAATRIQNLSQRPPTPEIHHRGLPQTYNRQRNSLGSRPPYSSGAIRSALEKSLTCATCSYTAKNLAEFSNHLVMHYVDSRENQVNNDLRNESQLDSLRNESQLDSLRNESQLDSLRNESQLVSLRNESLNSLTNQESQLSLRNSPNTSGYQPASDLYSGRSTAVTGNWQTPARYIYACQLCDFRTESKASIRLHEKNHSTVAVMRQKNLQRLQNHQMVQQVLQTQQQQNQQRQHQQRQQIQPRQPNQQRNQQINPTLSQLMESHKNQPIPDTSAEQNAVELYSRISRDLFQCQLCNICFSTQDELGRHLDLAHKESQKESVQDPADTSTVFFVCDYCETPQIFESEGNLRKHMNFLHNHMCQICSHRCTSRERLQSHLLRHKLDNQTQ